MFKKKLVSLDELGHGLGWGVGGGGCIADCLLLYNRIVLFHIIATAAQIHITVKPTVNQHC
jgi:hypothetical protein